ncbi:hypothetical protein V8G54_013710 [Vigna mungo]|uniref:Uncharacterized protein n=1 Tax=Vigna mungo TaxID=3915 RepID=A0AAQ3NF99_VIGMU
MSLNTVLLWLSYLSYSSYVTRKTIHYLPNSLMLEIQILLSHISLIKGCYYLMRLFFFLQARILRQMKDSDGNGMDLDLSTNKSLASMSKAWLIQMHSFLIYCYILGLTSAPSLEKLVSTLVKAAA